MKDILVLGSVSKVGLKITTGSNIYAEGDRMVVMIKLKFKQYFLGLRAVIFGYTISTSGHKSDICWLILCSNPNLIQGYHCASWQSMEWTGRNVTRRSFSK